MKWLLLVAIGCSDRPIPIPEIVRHFDAPDLAYADLAQPMCAGDCLCIGHACTSSSECCSSICDPHTYTCVNVQPQPDLAPFCSGPGDCVVSGCSCTVSADCCAGLACIVPPGALDGACGNPPPPPDMSCTEGVPAGGVCTTTADCCGVGLVCIVATGSLQGICTQDCACSVCGDMCFTIGHCCTTNSDCCSDVCETAAGGNRCGAI